jgi:hypothetical protein
MIMLTGLSLVWLLSLILLKADLGRSKSKPKISQLLSKSTSINRLSGARLCLFAARDVWFVVALPVYLAQQLGWAYWQVSGFLAAWIIGYGLVQMLTPRLTRNIQQKTSLTSFSWVHKTAFRWQSSLCLVPIIMALGLSMQGYDTVVLIVGLGVFGIVFAVNSTLHSYLILALAKTETVALDVGFYYMANAAGRLLGTLLSGWVFLEYGFIACLLLSSLLVALTACITFSMVGED